MAAPLPEPSDAELVRRVRVGGEVGARAEQDLCLRMFPRVRLFLGRHLAGNFDIEDLCHDVLIGLLEAVRAGRVEEPERVGSYTLGICRNKVREQLRHRRRRDRALARETAETFAEVPVARVMIGQLEECLHSLRERERVLLRLTFCEGLSSTLASEELDTTPENVRVARHRAIDRLRQCLRVGKYAAEQR